MEAIVVSRTESGAARWRTSSYSSGTGSNGDCVEIAHRAVGVAIRDSKRRSAGSLMISGASWAALLDTARR